MTRTPGSIGASPGTACGDDAVAPAATTGSKAIPSAPASRKLRSIHHASSRSLRPPNALLRERREDLVGQGAGAPHRRDLLVVLHGPQPFDEAGARHRVDARIRQGPVERVREVLLLEQDPAPGQELADGRDEPARGLHDLDALELPRPVRVAEVGVEGRLPVRLDENGRVRALQAGQVAHVRLAAEHVRRPGDEDRILLQELREPLDPAHARPPTRNSSASR